MAAGYLCDAGDSLPGAYLITDLATGDTAAWCGAHFTDLCAAVTRAAESEIAAEPETVTPQDVGDTGGDAGGPAEPVGVIDGGDADDGETVGPYGFADDTVERAMTDGALGNTMISSRDDVPTTTEPAQRERTRRKLAARP